MQLNSIGEQKTVTVTKGDIVTVVGVTESGEETVLRTTIATSGDANFEITSIDVTQVNSYSGSDNIYYFGSLIYDNGHKAVINAPRANKTYQVNLKTGLRTEIIDHSQFDGSSWYYMRKDYSDLSSYMLVNRANSLSPQRQSDGDNNNKSFYGYDRDGNQLFNKTNEDYPAWTQQAYKNNKYVAIFDVDGSFAGTEHEYRGFSTDFTTGKRTNITPQVASDPPGAAGATKVEPVVGYSESEDRIVTSYQTDYDGDGDYEVILQSIDSSGNTVDLERIDDENVSYSISTGSDIVYNGTVVNNVAIVYNASNDKIDIFDITTGDKLNTFNSRSCSQNYGINLGRADGVAYSNIGGCIFATNLNTMETQFIRDFNAEIVNNPVHDREKLTMNVEQGYIGIVTGNEEYTVYEVTVNKS
ncbi:hypothetical protein [Methanohalobium sp.]|uniref:hypothetical protein n=1 Tax=Methanohalobium sp. TaxID=2837493 RepID=UPI00318424DF